jgi:tetratricopeptide (TPR) repeat protein
MQPGERFALFLKIITPLLILVLFSTTPAAYSVSAGLQAARTAHENDQHQEAAAALRQVLFHEPWRVWLWEQVGQEEQDAARLPQAIEALTRAAAAGSLSPQGQYQLGEAYLEQKNANAAEACWQALLRKGKNLPEDLAARTYERLSQLQRSRGEFSAAVETLRAWHAADPKNPRATFLLGLQLSVVQPADALSLLVEAAGQDLSFSAIVQKIRTGINIAGESDDPGYSWLVIGRGLANAGQWDLAAEAFRQAVLAAPGYAEAWAFQGEAKFHLGKDGQVDLDRALALNAKSVVVRALLALNFRRQGKYDLALKNLEIVIALEPDEPMWEVELGNTWAEQGDLLAALEHFQKATTLAPQNSLYWQYLAKFALDYSVNVSTIGLPAARQAVVLAPDDPAALDIMGWTMVSLSDYATAERFLQQAVDRDATYTLALLHLGQLYLQEQNLDRAYSYLKRASLLAGEDTVGLVAKRLLLRYFSEGS